jgi:hypothetical protein
VATWAGAFFVVSTVVFGLGLGSALVADGTSRGQPLSAGLIAMMVGYGMFHWILLSAVTLPIFVSPVIAWAILARLAPALERSRSSMIVGVSCLAVLSVALRLAFLEYPGLRAMPGATLVAFIAAPSSKAELLATWLGLLTPRLCLTSLTTGAFTSTP